MNVHSFVTSASSSYLRHPATYGYDQAKLKVAEPFLSKNTEKLSVQYKALQHNGAEKPKSIFSNATAEKPASAKQEGTVSSKSTSASNTHLETKFPTLQRNTHSKILSSQPVLSKYDLTSPRNDETYRRDVYTSKFEYLVTQAEVLELRNKVITLETVTS